MSISCPYHEGYTAKVISLHVDVPQSSRVAGDHSKVTNCKSFVVFTKQLTLIGV